MNEKGEKIVGKGAVWSISGKRTPGIPGLSMRCNAYVDTVCALHAGTVLV